MPSILSYPGVYVEEIPSGVRTIVGGETSATALVDFFARGPLNTPVRITSFGDFVRRFGGSDRRSEASYAIQQYYVSGGSVAWVVRVDPGAGDINLAMKTSAASVLGGSPLQETLVVTATNPGSWGDNLYVTVESVANGLFNLVVEEIDPLTNEVVNLQVYRNLSTDKLNSRYFEPLINQDSGRIIDVQDTGIGDSPAVVTRQRLTNGSDGGVFLSTGNYVGGVSLTHFTQAIIGDELKKTGMWALQNFNILCLPVAATLDDANMTTLIAQAQAFAKKRRAFYIVDIPASVDSREDMLTFMNTHSIKDDYSAIYYPRLLIADARNNSLPRDVGASGTVAGVYARTDAERGFWKAPAGTDAVLRGILNVTDALTDLENGELNPLGINVLRNFPIYGNIAWGARTLKGSDQEASEWKYIPVRRTALYIERTLFESLKWVVFEPNDEPLWAQIRLSVGAFMHTLFRQGAFQGSTPRQAYLVKCDSETTTQTDINMGVVNILVGFAPLKPAEFVVIKIQQLAGQTEV